MHRSARFAIGILIPTASAVVFAAVWIAATGTFRPPWWALTAASVGLGVLSYVLETAGETRKRARSTLPRRRAHARTTPTPVRTESRDR